MKSNESAQEISWINGQPIPKGEVGDNTLTLIMLFLLIGVAMICALGGNRHD